MMNQLRELVRRYAANDVEYAAFRAAVVAQFSPASDIDAQVERLYDLIESACSAFENHYINDEAALKSHLYRAAFPAVVAQNVLSNVLADMSVVVVTSVLPVRYAQPIAVNSLAAFYGFGSATSAPEAEFELEEA